MVGQPGPLSYREPRRRRMDPEAMDGWKDVCRWGGDAELMFVYWLLVSALSTHGRCVEWRRREEEAEEEEEEEEEKRMSREGGSEV
jgi:hypothetical protein